MADKMLGKKSLLFVAGLLVLKYHQVTAWCTFTDTHVTSKHTLSRARIPNLSQGICCSLERNTKDKLSTKLSNAAENENEAKRKDFDLRNEKLKDELRRAFLASTLAAGTNLFISQNFVRPGFRRVQPTQFLAALGDPTTSNGTGAEKWGLWDMDPGPRGIFLNQFTDVEMTGASPSPGVFTTPTGWELNPKDFWLEEHGIIMETPQYNVPSGRYLVTGGRLRTSVLTIYAENENGVKRWSLDGGVLYDVTHLPCRSARYLVPDGGDASPRNARMEDFPVKPGAEMPAVQGCQKQDYAVLFVTGVEVP